MVFCRHCGEEIRQKPTGLWYSHLGGTRTTNPWIVQRCEVGQIQVHEPVLLIFQSLAEIEAWLEADL